MKGIVFLSNVMTEMGSKEYFRDRSAVHRQTFHAFRNDNRTYSART